MPRGSLVERWLAFTEHFSLQFAAAFPPVFKFSGTGTGEDVGEASSVRAWFPAVVGLYGLRDMSVSHPTLAPASTIPGLLAKEREEQLHALVTQQVFALYQEKYFVSE